MNGASEIFDLADDFGKAAAEIGGAMYETFKQGGQAFADDWRENTRQHEVDGGARFYPDSITSEPKISLSGPRIEVGPVTASGSRRQGFLGRVIELGGEHSPAYLDGYRALGPAADRLERASDATIGHLLP